VGWQTGGGGAHLAGRARSSTGSVRRRREEAGQNSALGGFL